MKNLDAVPERYLSEYWYDANGNIDTLARYDGSGDLYDGMKFGYHVDANDRKVRNRPYHFRELAGQGGTVATDIPHRPYQPDDIVDRYDLGGTVNTANNYGYDELGQRIRDDQGEMETIHWTVGGKVKAIVRPGASSKLDIHFGYDAGGNRIMKQVGENPDLGTGHREYYVRDAQGNIMAIYRYTNTGTASFRVMERPIYGSSRLGSYDRPRQLLGAQNIPAVATMSHTAKRYELTDHLGNVNTVATGRLLPGNGAGSAYQAEVVNAQGYEAFGALLPGRNYSSSNYRWGFNGKENANEWHGAVGTMQDYGMRAYDTRVGRFFAVDPIAAQFPMLTPYQFASNTPIWAIDLDGLEAVKNTDVDRKTGKTIIHITVDLKVRNSSETASKSAVMGWAAKIASQVEKTYSGTDGDVTYKTKVNLVMNEDATNFADVDASSDFFLDFVDQVEGTTEENIAGMATVGATSTNRIQVRWQSFHSPGVNRSDKSIIRTGLTK